MGAEDLRMFLRRKGLRFTREREAVWREAAARRGHFDPEDLLSSLRRKGLKVSRASVYRTLPLLVEAGLIGEVADTQRQTSYELVGRGHHDHMQCLSCGKVVEFYSEDLERLQEELCRRESFLGETHTLEIKGLCAKCARKEKGAQPS